MRLLCIIGHEIAENQFGPVLADFLCLFMPFFFVLPQSISKFVSTYLFVNNTQAHNLNLSLKTFFVPLRLFYAYNKAHNNMREHTFHVSGQKRISCFFLL